MNKEKILLFMPIFNGFEKIIKNELEKKYEVVFIDHALFYKDFLDSIHIPFFRKHYQLVYKILPFFLLKRKELKFSEKYFNLLNYPTNYFSKIFAIKADKVSSEIFKFLKINNPKADFILYEWDDVKRLLKKDHFIYFDKKFSYNIDDCRKYNMTYLPMFTDITKTIINDSKIYDIALICGYSDYKVKIAKKIYNANKNKYNFYIYIYDPNKKTNFFSFQEPLPYEDYIKITSLSKSSIEITHKRQNGPSTRCLDTLKLNTKIISTNSNIKKYPFFNENYMILNKTYKINEDFLDSPFYFNEYSPLTIQEWIYKLGL